MRARVCARVAHTRERAFVRACARVCIAYTDITMMWHANGMSPHGCHITHRLLLIQHNLNAQCNGSPWNSGGLASSTHERLLQRLAAFRTVSHASLSALNILSSPRNQSP